MHRDHAQLNKDFDLLIVGGGIHGAILASKAARAGYCVALIDQDDFGASTSANSLKIIHGGIRYLQHLNLKRMRESIRSRRSMMRFAPHLVQPLACLMPTYGHGIKGREMMRIAFALYDAVSFDRNRGLPDACRLPCGGALSAADCRMAIPGLEDPRLNGAALWYDAMAMNTERLLIEYLLDAARYGAVSVNYLKADSLDIRDNCVKGVVATDRLTGKRFHLRARVVINTAGPWVDQLPGAASSLTPVTPGKWAMALNIVVKKRLFQNYAVGLEGWSEFVDKDAFIKRGKRLFFFVPWREQYTIVGTLYKPYEGLPDSFMVKQSDVVGIVEEVNRIYPAAKLQLSDVTFCHGGLLPRKDEEDREDGADTVQLEKSTRIIDHRTRDSIDGLISVSGVKYTTAPDIADKLLALLEHQSILPARPNPPYQEQSGSRYRQDHTSLIKRLGGEYDRIRRHLVTTYGPNWREVFDYVIDSLGPEEDAEVLWVSEQPPLLAAEVYYFIKQECASKLGDVVFRRSPLGSAECPPSHVLENLADIMAHELNWSDEVRAGEIASIHHTFQPVAPDH